MTVSERFNKMTDTEKAIVMSDVCKYLCCDGDKDGLCNERHGSCFSALCDTLESEVKE
jgi:hypothetical protein